MQTLAALLAALAALATGDPPARPNDGFGDTCPVGAARVSGPPAAELFDPDAPMNGRATWCETYDARGRATRVGPYTDTYVDGSPRTWARFVDDALDGPVLIRHPNGRDWLRTAFVAGRIEGPYVIGRPDGSVWLRASFRQGRPEGTHTLYFSSDRTPDGALAAETRYVDGVEQGTARAWWPNGALRRELEIVDGVWSGRAATWHENGQLASEGEYAPCPEEHPSPPCEWLGAARHGRWQTWHENGERASSGHWRFGERVGMSVQRSESGDPLVIRVHHGDERVQSVWGSDADETPPVSSGPRPAAAAIPPN